MAARDDLHDRLARSPTGVSRANLLTWTGGTQVVIVGYQAAGSLCGRLVHGARRVRILGEGIEVRAGIHTLGGFSAHTGQSELAGWAGHYLSGPAHPRIVLTHGEDKPRQALGDLLESRH